MEKTLLSMIYTIPKKLKKNRRKNFFVGNLPEPKKV